MPASEDEPHGGRLAAARRAFPSAPQPFIDLSTGINPHPFPIPPLSPAAWTKLPEPEEIAALEAIAAHAYGVGDASLVAALPGSQLLISLLPVLFPQAKVAILSPTYNEYAKAFAASGVEVASLAALAHAPCAILANPNNPDGRRFEARELLALLDARGGEGLVVVDESFADLEEGDLSLAPHLPRNGLLVLRSLSKGHGLGGLRLGFALGAPHLVAAIRERLGPWPVSGPAIAIGMQALADDAWLASARTRLQADVQRLDAMLAAAGLNPLGGTLLFRLVASEDAGAIFNRLGAAGLLVRKFRRYPKWLRFGIPGDEPAWTRLGAALG